MQNRIVAVISLIVLITLGVSGQVSSKKYWEEKAYWKERVNDSKLIIVGTVEEDYQMIIRPEKYQLNPDGSAPTEEEMYVGRIFRVKVTGILKSEKKVKKSIENKYVNIFLYWIGGVPSQSEPIILKGMEYVLFLKPNDDKELEGKATIEFSPNRKRIIKPFDYKSSYLVIHGRRGAVELKGNEDKLIKAIKKSL
jgi:hypothetical protein